MGIYKKLRGRLDRAGLRPSTRRGQNFLLDTNLHHFIVATSGAGPDDVVLEVGPGTGLLTKRLALTGSLVFAVELDHGLLPLAQEETEGLPNVFFMQGDILAGKNHINPDVLARLRELFEEKKRMLRASGSSAEPKLKCVSNLPYSAGTPFVMNMLSSELPWDRGVFLLQREVGERMAAYPGGKDYGALAIMSGLASLTKSERAVAPQAFWPRPKVDSAVIRVDYFPEEERLGLPWRELRAISNAIFGSRRKILKNALKGLYPDTVNIESLLVELNLDPGGRGEALSPQEFLTLAQALKKHS